ncbi:Sid1 Transmembrane Family Member 1 [Manis pentadactyla]|nr:Sid1 Transmembrane Family Member 1 [Manis pentadactyla]
MNDSSRMAHLLPQHHQPHQEIQTLSLRSHKFYLKEKKNIQRNSNLETDLVPTFTCLLILLYLLNAHYLCT